MSYNISWQKYSDYEWCIMCGTQCRFPAFLVVHATHGELHQNYCLACFLSSCVMIYDACCVYHSRGTGKQLSSSMQDILKLFYYINLVRRSHIYLLWILHECQRQSHHRGFFTGFANPLAKPLASPRDIANNVLTMYRYTSTTMRVVSSYHLARWSYNS